jgi:hypothetical protein
MRATNTTIPNSLRGRLLTGALLAAVAALHLGANTTPDVDEHDVKAAFVYNFAAFTTFPESAFAGPAEPLAVVILATESSAADAAQSVVRALKDKKINGRNVRCRVIDNVNDIADLHVLYAPDADDKIVRAMLARVAGKPVLTITDVDASMDCGQMLRLVVEGKKVRFDANPPAAEAVGLKLSPQLLKLARANGGRQ